MISAMSLKKSFVTFERWFEPVCIVVLITLMTFIICLQIIMRLFDASMPEAEEIARFLFVWAMYLSISYAIRDDRHIRISVIIDKFSGNARMIIDNCIDLIFIIYSVVIFVFGWRVIMQSLELGQIAPATELPIAVIYGSVFIGAVLNVFRLSLRLYSRTFGKERSKSAGANL